MVGVSVGASVATGIGSTAGITSDEGPAGSSGSLGGAVGETAVTTATVPSPRLLSMPPMMTAPAAKATTTNAIRAQMGTPREGSRRRDRRRRPRRLKLRRRCSAHGQRLFHLGDLLIALVHVLLRGPRNDLLHLDRN
jgi:hypothetical protein